MALTYQPAVGVANRRERRIGLDPEDRVGVLRPIGFDADMVCPDAGIIARVEPEMPSDLAQIVILGRANPAVGERYMEQAAEEIRMQGVALYEEAWSEYERTHGLRHPVRFYQEGLVSAL